ncbi:hypothetical protein CAL29_14785 [Bordetella genomosp. 10]|uniref:Carrier domain-containing protein n=1 Tax=Bordetella genomosp. 10 TaxID=1416804 RepID=A0A261SC47_9BORD|nr:non-ribosomal peptide synthetase [Bordetella genomosp. 10]OZI34735.1 hypothetical protein CAL29_14785 [Bordetella genomosp. 10]
MSESSNLDSRRAALTPAQKEALRARIRGGGPAGRAAPALISPLPEGVDAVLSHAQQRLWFLWRLAPADTAYHLGAGLRLHGDLDVKALERTLHTLTRRHASLHTAFPAGADGQPVPVRCEEGAPPLPLTDLTAQPEPRREETLQALKTRLFEQAFDLERGPLIRYALIRMASNEHCLLVVIHHIVADAWSTQLILDQLGPAYASEIGARDETARGAIAQRESGIPGVARVDADPPPVGYADFAHYQRLWLEGPEGARQLAYWVQRLQGDAPEPLVQPDHVHAGQRSGRATTMAYALRPEVVGGLRRRAARLQASMFAVLLAGLQATLFRRTRGGDVRIGVPYANRTMAQTRDIVGLFANTLVLRVPVEGSLPVDDLILRTRDAAAEAQGAQDLPFDRLVEALRPTRRLGETPLFQVMYNHLRQRHAPLAQWTGLRVEYFDLPNTGAQADFQIETVEYDDDRVTVNLRFAADLFDEATIRALADQYLAVLQDIAVGSRVNIDDLAMQDATALRRVHANGAGPVVAWPRRPVHKAFEAQALLRPDATALACADGAVLTYRELNARANALAAILVAQDVAPDHAVGILLHRSVDMVVAILGVMKAGGAYVPLDPEYPADRLVYMLQDSRMDILLTVTELAAIVPEQAPARATLRVINMDSLDAPAVPCGDPDVPLHPDNLAYIIYTSGSTGRPKGTCNTHGALANRIAWMQDAYRLDDADVVLQKTSFSFDVSVWEFFWPLMQGASIALLAAGAQRDSALVCAAIKRYRVTTLHFVPSMLDAFLLNGDAPACTSLRRLVCSGESLPVDLKNRALSLLPDAALYNLYGPTEAAIDVTHWTCRPEDAIVPIGRPIANLRTYVIDDALALMPAGQAAELYLGGAGLARGYLGKAALTAERFVPDFINGGGGRLYRTGDLARWSDGGVLEYLGRRDDQVKLRGFRVELGEIESILAERRDVRQAVVVARKDDAGTRLHAYVTAMHAAALDTDALKADLAARLPAYMVPTQVQVLEQLPVNANGKADRKALAALPERTAVATVATDTDQGVRTPTESKLVEVWRTVLGVADIGTEQNFFELGGDSILVLKMVALAARAGIEVVPADLFAHQTVRALAAAIEGRAPRQGEPLPRAPELRHRAPASAAQRRLCLLWNLAPASSAYHIVGALTLKGGLAPDTLRAAFERMVAANEALRTTFDMEDEGLFQVIHDTLPCGWETRDLTDDPAGLQASIQAYAERPFDLRRGPLLRAAVYRLGPDHHVLAVVLHHVVADGWAMQLLLRDVLAALAGTRPIQALTAAGGAMPVASGSPPLQYADYAVWEAQWLSGAAARAQLSYWTRRLAGPVAPLELSADHPRRAEPRYTVARQSMCIDALVAQQLRLAARTRGDTVFVLLHAAWHILLHRYTGQTSLRVGVTEANRSQAAFAETIGLFVNTQIIATALTPGMTAAQAVAQVGTALAEARDNQGLPFDAVVDALQPERGARHGPLVQVLHNHQRQLAMPPAPVGMDVSLCPLALALDAQFEIALESEERDDGGIVITLAYARELFDQSTASRLVQHYIKVLLTCLRKPGARLGELAMLDEGEQGVLRTLAQPALAADSGPDFLVAIADWARVEPGAPALRCGATRWTRGVLGERIQALTRRLVAMGIGPGSLVGVAMARTPDLPATLLAVLTTGAAYVPLSPALPSDRLSYMIEDSGITILLSQAAVLPTLPDRPGLQRVAIDLPWPAEAERAEQTAMGADGYERQPGSLAYVIYTSGSTGRPKGVMVPYGALQNFLSSMRRQPGLRAGETLLAVTSLSFDIAALELFLPLMAGGELILATDGETRDAGALSSMLEAGRVDVLQATPAMLQLLLDSGWSPVGMRVLCGGEAMPGSLADRLLAEGVALWNMYGPTETTIWSLTGRMRAGRADLGAPVAGTTAYVLDGEAEMLPLGASGELCLGGMGLARGYLGKPGLTAERFVPDPFGDQGERLYRTGDVVRRAGDGSVNYLGRRDHQIKIRGFRVELGEIESQLSSYAGVRQAVVVTWNMAAGVVLVGYVTVDPDVDVDPAALRSALATALPDYMVPAQIVRLDQLPLNSNGKVDRKALPMPVASSAPRSLPADDVERAVAAQWQAALAVDDIGREDDFFDLGGNSLAAMQCLARLNARYGVGVPFSVFYGSPRLGALADAIRRAVADRTGNATGIGADDQHTDAGRASPSDPAAASAASGRADSATLAPLQRRIWLADRLARDAERASYNMGSAFDIAGKLDHGALGRALHALVERHAILRSAYPEDDDGEASVVTVGKIDLTLETRSYEGDDARWPAWRDARLRDMSKAPFDLGVAPLLRIEVVRRSADRHALLLVVHHIIFDGTSASIFLRELGVLYNAFRAGRASPLPPLALQYADYAMDAEQTVLGNRNRLETYWREALGDVPSFALDTPEPGEEGAGAANARPGAAGSSYVLRQHVSLNETLAPGSLFPRLFAALGLSMHGKQGLDDAILGVDVAGRNASALGDLIGFFVNVLPVRSRVTSDMTVASYLDDLRRRFAEAADHQALPYEDIARTAQKTRKRLGVADRHPLVRVLFVMQDSVPVPQFDGLTIVPTPAPYGAAKFDLTVFVTPQGHGLDVDWVFDPRVCASAAVEDLAAAWGDVAGALLRMDPDFLACRARLAVRPGAEKTLDPLA